MCNLLLYQIITAFTLLFTVCQAGYLDGGLEGYDGHIDAGYEGGLEISNYGGGDDKGYEINVSKTLHCHLPQ